MSVTKEILFIVDWGGDFRRRNLARRKLCLREKGKNTEKVCH
jgi:hypothetical protein